MFVICFILFLFGSSVSGNKNATLCQYSGYCDIKASSSSSHACYPGNKCVVQMHYPQCVPDPSQYSTAIDCIANNGAACSSTSQCCDPGAICRSDTKSGNFPQCQQPTAASGLCVTVLSFPPSAAPSHAPKHSKAPIAAKRGPSVQPSVLPAHKPSLKPSTRPSANHHHSAIPISSLPSKGQIV